MQASARRYFLPWLVYLGAVVLVLCLAVLAGSFSRIVDGARVSGRFSPFPLFNRTRLEALTVSWNGLDLAFARTAVPGVLKFETAGDEADIVAGDARLRLTSTDDRGSTLTIAQVAGPAAPAALMLAIPFKVSGILQGDSAPTVLSWRTTQGSFQLSLPPDARIDYAARLISLRLGPGLPSLRLAFVSPSSGQETLPQPARLPDEKSLPTQQQLAAALSRFSDLAYAGWSASRFSADGGTWRMPDGKQGLAEGIGVGLLAEASARGTFADMLQLWSHALDDQPDQGSGLALSYASCVFTGRVREFVRRLQDQDPAALERLRGLVARGDASLADQPGALLFALDRGGLGLAKSALSVLRGLDVGTLSPTQLLGVLESLEDYQQYIGDDPSVIPAARDLIRMRIIPSVASTGDGSVYLRLPAGGVDVKQSIRCGSLLLRAGALLQDSRVSALGRGLITSSLELAADDGFLPATLSLALGRIASRDGVLAPEAVYGLLPGASRLPHEVPLFRVLGQGCWVWTAAQLVSADQAGNDVRLVFSYPAGVPHHLVFRGLRTFEQVRLHGIPWHSDPSYAKYSDGWSYDEQTRTLFMKITGRQDREEVDISF